MGESEILSLLPEIIDEEDRAYSSVDELYNVINHALKEGGIKNIALTGPYGAGKSSVIKTLRDECKEDKEFFFSISLATLQSDSKGASVIELDTQKHGEQNEQLNHRIEYSILQQLIYRENSGSSDIWSDAAIVQRI